MEDFKEKILNYCQHNKFKKLAIIGVNGLRHINLVEKLKKNSEVDIFDFSPFHKEKYEYNCVDVIFDECNFDDYDAIINLSAEHMYPMAKIHKGHYILVLHKSTEQNPRMPTKIDSDHNINIKEFFNCERKYIFIGDSL